MQREKELVNVLDYSKIKFPVSKEDFNYIEAQKIAFPSMFFVMKKNRRLQFTFQMKNLKI